MRITRREIIAGSAIAAGLTSTRLGAHDHRDHGDHTHQDVPNDQTLRVQALESLLVQKGIVDPKALDVIVDIYANKVGPRNGAQVVARAWTDPKYKERLLANGTKAIGELGFSGHQGGDIRVVENTASVHNLVTCTLCSCYPWPVLGLPPTWYKSAPFRAQSVIDPRGVCRELGLVLPENIEVRVWDSTAEQRYLVLPQRPVGTEALTEAELANLVTRDSMIGTARIYPPIGNRS